MSEWRVFVAETKGREATPRAAERHLSHPLRRPDVAIGVAMVLASFLFMRRMAEVTGVDR